jgi:hypothetical protein
MRVFIVFDAYADSYQVSGRIGELKSINGVKSVEALERVAGEAPRYCLAFDIDDDTAQETGARLKETLGQYSSYMSNVAWGAYKKIG